MMSLLSRITYLDVWLSPRMTITLKVPFSLFDVSRTFKNNTNILSKMASGTSLDVLRGGMML